VYTLTYPIRRHPRDIAMSQKLPLFIFLSVGSAEEGPVFCHGTPCAIHCQQLDLRSVSLDAPAYCGGAPQAIGIWL